MEINFGKGEHNTVIGRTRSGKTTGTLLSLQRQKKGVLFFNTQLIKFPRGWTAASHQTDFDAMVNALHSGEKIVYNPSREYRQQELKVLIQLLYKAAEANDGQLDMFLVVDEVHLYEKAALKACIEVATTGIRWGINAIWISQRPAKIDNTLMTQSTRFVIYDVSHMESSYFKNYQMPSDAIYAALKGVGQYGFAIYDGHELTGHSKVAM